MIKTFVTDSKEALAAMESKNVTNVWINGSVTYVTTKDSVIAEEPVLEPKSTRKHKSAQ